MGKGRAPCCDKSKVKRGPWSPAEDLKLTTFIRNHGHTNWRALPKQAGLLRCGKSCRLRWINYLRPDVKRGNFTPEEELTIINLHNSFGNKWSKIASYLPGRTDNEIKNVWNTHLKKRLIMTKNSLAEDYCHKENSSSESLTSSNASHFSNSASLNDNKGNEAFEFSESELLMNPDDGLKIEIPLDSDTDFWELFDLLDDPLHSVKRAENEEGSNPAEKLECSKWFRLLENELGLTNDVDHQSTVPTTSQYEEMNLEPEIGRGLGFDYFPMWPSSPQNLGI